MTINNETKDIKIHIDVVEYLVKYTVKKHNVLKEQRVKYTPIDSIKIGIASILQLNSIILFAQPKTIQLFFCFSCFFVFVFCLCFVNNYDYDSS